MRNLIQQQVPLNDKNWFKTGGSAEFYAAPRSPEEYAQAIIFAEKQKLPITLIGEGANILISDTGIPGLVIRPELKNIVFDSIDSHLLVTAQAGVSMGTLIERCLDNSALGLEEFSGIPGTVGGSVFINIHYFEFLLSNFLVSGTIIDAQTGEYKIVNRDWFNFDYNYSTLHERKYYLLDATFKLKKAQDQLEVAFARGRRVEIIRHRAARYPTQGTCGSFFRNFLPQEVSLESAGKKLIYVAYYLDKIGVKGTLSCGDAIVSYQHANMLVNNGNATTADLLTVARNMQQKVYDNFGIIPQPECQLLGFSHYPLMQ